MFWLNKTFFGDSERTYANCRQILRASNLKTNRENGSKPEKYRVIKEYESACPDPMVFQEGEKVKVGQEFRKILIGKIRCGAKQPTTRKLGFQNNASKLTA